MFHHVFARPARAAACLAVPSPAASIRGGLCALLALSAIAMPAAAHVSIDPPQAAPLAYVRAALRVPHGCGDAATTRIEVRLPEGLTGARPMPKPGWNLVLTPREAGTAPAGHGAVRDLAAIAWEGGRLANEHYDEFVLRFRVPDRANETLWFAVRQDCEGGRSVDWSQIPAEGRRLSDYPTPAASMRLVPR